ncbi:MAG: response regulator transcription factor [Christensenella sp.]|uniref:response regulator transcription factor n=1 Tax=Christensenella sp. TaxID=1935934 RepID=UPI002B21E987|nr:response regulator transcription factor [Christensenella sp.]MEA5003517.1 response regulator transcription factor [Christensenella sp.]
MKRILIVEDDKSIAELERDYLQANGFEVTNVFTGTEGLEEALGNEYATIVLDVMLPGVDGFEICRRLREKKDTPVIMVSARREDIDKIRGLGLGADDYMVKPFSPSELVARVQAHIARYKRLTGASKEDKANRIETDGLVIDVEARRIFLAGQEVVFKNKEFELLAFLASHPNVVFSKETLFDRIWGMEPFGDTATVTVHINRIRDKIERGGKKYIETVWGSGYRFRG